MRPQERKDCFESLAARFNYLSSKDREIVSILIDLYYKAEHYDPYKKLGRLSQKSTRLDQKFKSIIDILSNDIFDPSNFPYEKLWWDFFVIENKIDEGFQLEDLRELPFVERNPVLLSQIFASLTTQASRFSYKVILLDILESCTKFIEDYNNGKIEDDEEGSMEILFSNCTSILKIFNSSKIRKSINEQ